MTLTQQATPEIQRAITVDPITTEIVRNAFIAAAQDMNANLIRSAHSPLIYEMRDCSVGIFDRNADLLGQAAGLPIFLGNLDETIKVTIRKYGYDGIHDGDVFVVNDSYLTGTHVGDVTVVSPIFHQGELVGFTASRAHWLDIGSKDASIPVDTTEIYHEGLRLPPTRVVSRGKMVTDLLEILKLNSRLPLILEGDFNAQIAAARTGERSYQAILDRFGRDTVAAATRAIFAQAAELDRLAVEALPDGEYRAEGFLDDDGQSDEPVWVRVKIVIAGDRMTIDLSGSNPAVGGNTNCGRPQSISGCRVAFKMLINPSIPVTGGTFAPLDVVIEAGSIFAAENPSACQMYFAPLGLLIDLVQQALAPVLPDRVAAAHFGDSMLISMAVAGKSYLIHTQANSGGWGGSQGRDGESALINNVNGSLKSIPVEVAEGVFPIKINRYALNIGSSGAGQWRGGLGTVKEYETTAAETRFTINLDRAKMPGCGLFGGASGIGPRAVFEFPDGSTEIHRKVNAHRVPAGTRVSLETGGGGGYGPATERAHDAIERDLREGYITPETAASDYGFSR